MSPHKRKCDVLGFIGTTLLLLTIVTCSSIGTAMPTFGQKQTSNSLCNKGSNCLIYSHIMDIPSDSTETDYATYKFELDREKYDYDHDKLNGWKFLRNNEDIDVKNRYLTAKHISLFLMQSRIWELNVRDCDEHVMFNATQLPQPSCNWINYRKIKETYLLDQGHNNLFDDIIVQRRLVHMMDNKHQEQKHTGEYKLYLIGNLPRNQYQHIDLHFFSFMDNHVNTNYTIYLKKQLGDLTIIRNGGMDLYTYPVYYSLYDHMTTDWNIIERSRECSNYKHLSESAENCLRSSLSNDPVSYDSNLYYRAFNWEELNQPGEYINCRHKILPYFRLEYLCNVWNKRYMLIGFSIDRHKNAFHDEFLQNHTYGYSVSLNCDHTLSMTMFITAYNDNAVDADMIDFDHHYFEELTFEVIFMNETEYLGNLRRESVVAIFLYQHLHQDLSNDRNKDSSHFHILTVLRKRELYTKHLMKIEFEVIRFLTETQHPQYLRRTRVNAVFSYPNQCLNIDSTQHSLYFRLLSAFHRDAFFAEYLENFYRKETHKLKYQVTTHLKMTNAEFLTTAYSEMLIRFTQSEPNIHSKNGGDRILRDHLDSIRGIDATVLLILLLLSNLSIRIVNQEECIKAGSSHSQILKVAAKERKQNFPTENQEKGVRLCEMCVNQNSTVAHCKTCKLYICAACSILHERVWALMNHTLCPFKEI